MMIDKQSQTTNILHRVMPFPPQELLYFVGFFVLWRDLIYIACALQRGSILCVLQLMQILAVNSRMTRDRQLLAKEVEFLRKQLSHINTSEAIRLTSSSKPLVDDILNALTKEERDGGAPVIAALRLRDLTKTPTEFEEEAQAKEDLD